MDQDLSSLPSSREEALRIGAKKFFSGQPCKHGHVAARYVSSKGCLECEAAYREKNRDKVRESGRLYRERNLEKERSRQRLHYENNREKVTARNRDYRASNIKQVRDRDRLWRERNLDTVAEKNRRYRKSNIDKVRDQNRLYRNGNRDRCRLHGSNRRARKLNATPAWFSELDELVIIEAFDLAHIRKKATSIEWHVDHMVPLLAKKACGLHCAANIQVIPAAMNYSKNNKMVLTDPGQWINVL